MFPAAFNYNCFRSLHPRSYLDSQDETGRRKVWKSGKFSWERQTRRSQLANLKPKTLAVESIVKFALFATSAPKRNCSKEALAKVLFGKRNFSLFRSFRYDLHDCIFLDCCFVEQAFLHSFPSAWQQRWTFGGESRRVFRFILIHHKTFVCIFRSSLMQKYLSKKAVFLRLVLNNIY